MAFNFPETMTGDFLPIITYDTRAGRMHRVDRVKDDRGSFVKQKTDVTAGFRVLMDLEHLETGWVRFANAVPDFRMAPYPGEIPERPSTDYRPAIRVRVYSPKTLGDGPREFSHSARVVIDAVSALWCRWADTKAAHPGEVPLVELRGVTPVGVWTPQGEQSFYQPDFEIVGWYPRPIELPHATPTAAQRNGSAEDRPTAPAAAPAPVFSGEGLTPPARDDLDDDVPF